MNLPASARFWTAPVLWRSWGRDDHCKAPEDWRSPKRWRAVERFRGSIREFRFGEFSPNLLPRGEGEVQPVQVMSERLTAA